MICTRGRWLRCFYKCIVYLVCVQMPPVRIIIYRSSPDSIVLRIVKCWWNDYTRANTTQAHTCSYIENHSGETCWSADQLIRCHSLGDWTHTSVAQMSSLCRCINEWGHNVCVCLCVCVCVCIWIFCLGYVLILPSTVTVLTRLQYHLVVMAPVISGNTPMNDSLTLTTETVVDRSSVVFAIGDHKTGRRISSFAICTSSCNIDMSREN